MISLKRAVGIGQFDSKHSETMKPTYSVFFFTKWWHWINSPWLGVWAEHRSPHKKPFKSHCHFASVICFPLLLYSLVAHLCQSVKVCVLRFCGVREYFCQNASCQVPPSSKSLPEIQNLESHDSVKYFYAVWSVRDLLSSRATQPNLLSHVIFRLVFTCRVSAS